MKGIGKIYLPYFPVLLLTGILIILQAVLQLELPKYMAKIINEGIVKGNQALIYETGGFMLLLSFLVAFAAVVVSFLASTISAKGSAKIRSQLFDKVSAMSSGEIEAFGVSSLITRATNDVLQVQMATVMLLRIGFFAPAMGIGALIMAIRTSPDLTWTIVVALGALLFFIFLSIALSLPKFKILQKLIDRLNLIVNERLKGMLVIRAFRREDFEENRFDQANAKLMKTNLFVSRLMSLMMPVMTLIMSYGSVLVVWAGAKLINLDRLAVGDMMAFVQYAMHVVMSFLFLTMFFIMLPRAIISLQRIHEVLSVNPSIKDPLEGERESLPISTKGQVIFNSVFFKYPEAEECVLSDISFKAEPGTVTAIVGGTGSGKSSLINLLPRFYDVSSGVITIDGVDIRKLDLENLRDLISYVPQKGLLFKGTIRSNVSYSDSQMSLERINRAIDVSQSRAIVDEKSEGLASPINQGGTNVSGGQRQRLSIARALAKEAPIYILDDSFSALDFQTEVSLRRALLEMAQGKTILVVAQRISTVKDAHQIIVLDEGRMVGIGSHKELIATCDVYRELAISQQQYREGEDYGRS